MIVYAVRELLLVTYTGRGERSADSLRERSWPLTLRSPRSALYVTIDHPEFARKRVLSLYSKLGPSSLFHPHEQWSHRLRLNADLTPPLDNGHSCPRHCYPTIVEMESRDRRHQTLQKTE